MADGDGADGSVDGADGCVGGGHPDATEVTEVLTVGWVAVAERVVLVVLKAVTVAGRAEALDEVLKVMGEGSVAAA